MQVHFFGDFTALLRKYSVIILALFITAGFIFGAFFAWSSSDELFLLMRTVPQRRVSIVGILAVSALPFFLFYFVVSSGRTWLLYPICFFKAFSWSYCSILTVFAFGSAGWLIHILLLFSDTALLPVFFFFAIGYISGENRLKQTDLFTFICISAVIGGLDYCFISPYLAMIL